MNFAQRPLSVEVLINKHNFTYVLNLQPTDLRAAALMSPSWPNETL